MTKKDITLILKALEEMYPDAAPQLNYSNPYELLISAILSAQCTDNQVNKVTKVLFEHYDTPQALAAANITRIENIIRPCGFYTVKAKNIIAAASIVTEKHGGNVPQTMDALLELPGVGRKVANVVLSNAFDTPAIAVDTHVFRVANRIGLAHARDVFGTEKQLMERIPRKQWSIAHHWLIFHGRRICGAKKPRCEDCGISKWCEFIKT